MIPVKLSELFGTIKTAVLKVFTSAANNYKVNYARFVLHSVPTTTVLFKETGLFYPSLRISGVSCSASVLQQLYTFLFNDEQVKKTSFCTI